MRMQGFEKSKALVGALAVALLVGGCASGQQTLGPPLAEASSPPVIESAASEYVSLEQLAENASAIVLVTATDSTRLEPAPMSTTASNGLAGTAPTPYVTVAVDQVLSGVVSASTGVPSQHDSEQPHFIDVVNPTELHANGSAIVLGRSYILFITPAMYAAEQPTGGYAVIGATQGMYEQGDGVFSLVDLNNVHLPASIDIAKQIWPSIPTSEQDLLALGPR